MPSNVPVEILLNNAQWRVMHNSTQAIGGRTTATSPMVMHPTDVCESITICPSAWNQKQTANQAPVFSRDLQELLKSSNLSIGYYSPWMHGHLALDP